MGKLLLATGEGFTTTAVVAGLALVVDEVDELVVDDVVERVTSGVPPATRFPLLHDDCVVS